MTNTVRNSFVALLVVSATLSQAQFTLFAAESVAGSNPQPLWGGVRQYDWTGNSGTSSLGAGIAASNLSDPVGLRAIGNQLYVANRHGNQAGLGSIQRFGFDGVNLTSNMALTGNGLQRTHGVDVSSTTGELFGANSNGGVSRFLPAGPTFSPNGMFNTGDLRDVLVSSDGTKIYQSTPSNFIRVTDIASGTTTNFAVAASSAMHQMQLHAGSLYVTSFNTGTVHKVVLDANLNPVSSSVILNYSGAIGVAFSPDGQEMFVSSHTGNTIGRFLDNGAGLWQQTGQINTGVNMGYLATMDAVPEPATMVLMGLGAAAIAAKRRKRS